MRPQHLRANQPPDRFYSGGSRIADLRGTPAVPGSVPEDWVASTTTLFGHDRTGLSRLPDGELLRDAVEADPVAWLGAAHVARWGSDTALLVKLLDPGRRLPVHAHPDVPFASTRLGLTHGKTEAWVFLRPGTVHLGFTRDVGAAELRRWVTEQDVDALLGATHRMHVERGDAVLVPAGTPHAIGEGAFLVELQEPTDLSVLLEWSGFDLDGPRDGHLGLGLDVALAAVDRRGLDPAAVERLRCARLGDTGDLLPAAAQFFRAERWVRSGDWDAGYAVVVVAAGSGDLVTADGRRTMLSRGDTVVVPHAAGACRLEADAGLELLRCRPPAP